MDAAEMRPDAPVQTQPTNPCAFTGALATYDFSAQAGNESNVPAATTATGITAGAVTRSAGLTSTSGSGSINAYGWPTAATIDKTKYYAFTITPPSGCTIAIASLSIDARASGTGPASASLGTDTDNFAALVTLSTATASTPALTVSADHAIEIRVYGYGASGAMGTLRIQNTLTVTGSTM